MTLLRHPPIHTIPPKRLTLSLKPLILLEKNIFFPFKISNHIFQLSLLINNVVIFHLPPGLFLLKIKDHLASLGVCLLGLPLSFVHPLLVVLLVASRLQVLCLRFVLQFLLKLIDFVLEHAFNLAMVFESCLKVLDFNLGVSLGNGELLLVELVLLFEFLSAAVVFRLERGVGVDHFLDL